MTIALVVLLYLFFLVLFFLYITGERVKQVEFEEDLAKVFYSSERLDKRIREVREEKQGK